MNNEALLAFSDSFHRDIAGEAEALEMLREHAFVEKMAETLVDYGELLGCEPCHYQARGVKVDGYDFDDDHSTLAIVVAHWLDEPDPAAATVANGDIQRALKRGQNFVTESLAGKLAARIDVSNPAHDLAALIYECRKDLTSVKIILVTDGVAQERPAELAEHDGIEVTSVVWDISRTHTFERTGQRETIAIDFVADYGQAVPFLAHESIGGQYTCYLAYVNGEVLADLYDKWKIRLLERNVRVFLSQRPKVNQGIRDTIRDEPELFCAYNNGITVYAESLDLVDLSDGGVGIGRVKDFQIVNGGQTTASLYHTRQKYKSDLSAVQVQMKLMVVHETARPYGLPEELRLADVLVPKIGRFSNTQNRVQMADLLANDPPHPELHAISLNTPAPDPTGGSVQTFWFYEKSRGGWEETRRLTARTPAQQKKFDQKYPKKQRFDKDRFGKAWNSYRRMPHVVCLGGMKNFARFNNWLQELKNEEWLSFFMRSVALVLLWRETERIVRRKKFGGYTHANVAYTLAWFHELTHLKLDLDKLWQNQAVDPRLLDTLGDLCEIINTEIRKTKLNVTEWCKKEDCWEAIRVLPAPTLPDLGDVLLSESSGSKYVPDRSEERDNIEFCKERGADAWFGLSKWLKQRDFMSGKQRSQCFNIGRKIANEGDPSGVLAYACRKIWEQAEQSYGWSFDPAVAEADSD